MLQDILNSLPNLQGKLRKNADLSKTTWFRVGGLAELLFKPANEDDLSYFLKNTSFKDITILGVGSNILVRDSGIEGLTIKLGQGFHFINFNEDYVECGAAILDYQLAIAAAEKSYGGLEFLSGIPGTIGGAIAMNAGAYGGDIESVFISANAVDFKGNKLTLFPSDMKYVYRGNNLGKEVIFTSAKLKIVKGKQPEIQEKINYIKEQREFSQPIKSRTGGSTFKNPPDRRAWELIDKAGCRGLKVGDAEVSTKHCNFLINNGKATASDLENLGEKVREAVFQETGVNLEWEIKILGKK